ncbi:MAG: cytochrome c3 family protein [Deltaproteobacteria bacterium]|nr:cytochrome c3 family protein [Deltaproteobacteria bacterium]
MRSRGGGGVGWLVIAAALAVAAAGGRVGAQWATQRDGPVQPVAYSHKVHAGDNQIPCLFCHAEARRSPQAGIPSLQRCVGCHQITAAGRPEVKKVLQAWATKTPIAWVRVHDLPDFVYFSHAPHVRAEVTCQTCHGPVETMERVRQVATLKMGWCLECHRRPRVTTVRQATASPQASAGPQATTEPQAPTDCLACHK